MEFWSPAEVGIEEGSSEGESFTLSSLHRTSALVPGDGDDPNWMVPANGCALEWMEGWRDGCMKKWYALIKYSETRIYNGVEKVSSVDTTSK